jgi:hypothetical protein
MTPLPRTRYELQLEVLERDGALGDAEAIALLGSEFALAINASYFSHLTDEHIAVRVVSREIPQDGVARYMVALELVESTPGMSDDEAEALLRREFSRALNASYFMRVSGEDFGVLLGARTDVSTRVALGS